MVETLKTPLKNWRSRLVYSAKHVLIDNMRKTGPLPRQKKTGKINCFNFGYSSMSHLHVHFSSKENLSIWSQDSFLWENSFTWEADRKLVEERILHLLSYRWHPQESHWLSSKSLCLWLMNGLHNWLMYVCTYNSQTCWSQMSMWYCGTQVEDQFNLLNSMSKVLEAFVEI